MVEPAQQLNVLGAIVPQVPARVAAAAVEQGLFFISNSHQFNLPLSSLSLWIVVST